MKTRVPFALALPLFLLSAGCSKESTAPPRPTLSITPADGAAGVRLDASVVLDFTAPADRPTVEGSFHLLWEGAMNDSLCSSDSMVVGDMTSMMADRGMMDYMVGAHATAGQFHWNGDAQCVFTPDQPMAPDSRYMIYLGPEMAGMMDSETMMGSHGMSSEMTLHFTTLDPASHDGHHGAAAPRGGEHR